MHSSGKNSLAVGLSPYKIAKKDAFSAFFVLNDSSSNFYVTNEITYDIIKMYKRK